MSEDLELEENLEIENDAPEIENEEQGDTPEDIARAKKVGYKTDDEYDGNPKYKLSAKEYLARADKGGTIKKLESDITEMRSAFEQMQKFTQLQIKSAKERALEELRAKQVKAVDDGNTTTSEAFDIYEREKVKVEKQYSPEPEVKRVAEAPEITQFYQENPWYHDNVVMRGAANALHQEVISKNPSMPLDEQLKLVKRKVIESFPERFENQKKRTQSIEGGGTVHSGTQKRETLQSLGFSHQDILDVKRSISEGLYKDESDFIKKFTLLNKGRK